MDDKFSQVITEPHEGIFRIAVPVPLPLKYVYGYVIETPQGYLVVDLGMDTPEARAVWEHVSRTLGLRPGRVWAIAITHFHPDHVGLSGFAQALWDCPVLMLEEEVHTVYQIFDGPPLPMGEFFSRNGLPPADAELLERERAVTQAVVRLPQSGPIQGLQKGTRLGPLELLEQKGHTDHQLLLYWPERKLLFTGDQVLNRITPNISFWPDSDPDPLASYLDSLHTLQSLPIAMGLPAHESLIANVSRRIDELAAHHQERADQVLESLSEPKTAYEVARGLFHRTLTPSQWRFALSESLAHLEYLRLRGLVAHTVSEQFTLYQRADR